MKHTIFEYDSYKSFLREYIDINRRPGIIADIASAAGCDRTYLSQAMSSKVQLTPDHILGISEYLRMTDAEQNFFLLLNLYERASNPNSAKIIKAKMEKLAKENLILTKKIQDSDKAGELTEAQKSLYYSTWMMAAIHVISDAKNYHSATAIAERFRMDVKMVEDMLADLVSMKLVKRTADGYTHAGNNFHIPNGTSHNILNHMHWRNRAVEQANVKEGIHYTDVFTISKKDFPKFKRQLLDYIDKHRSSVGASGSEDVYCFCCDLFSPK